MKSFLHPSISLPPRIYIAGGFVRSTSHSITASFLHQFCASLARGGFLPIWASRKRGFYHPCVQCFSFPSQALWTAEEQAAPRQRALRQGAQEVPANQCSELFIFAAPVAIWIVCPDIITSDLGPDPPSPVRRTIAPIPKVDMRCRAISNHCFLETWLAMVPSFVPHTHY